MSYKTDAAVEYVASLKWFKHCQKSLRRSQMEHSTSREEEAEVQLDSAARRLHLSLELFLKQ